MFRGKFEKGHFRRVSAAAKLTVGVGLMLLMLCRPEDAANGAREGLCQWYYVVAPSLFPFMALMPLLTCPEAGRFYDAALGGCMRWVFGLPGSAASPILVGMLAGSPAGCVAARSVAAGQGYSQGQLERVAMACSGLSPAFFISAVGAGMLGNVGWGHLLLRSQLLAQLSMLALTRLFCRDERRVEVGDDGVALNPVLSIINVAGYMALFGAVAGALRRPWTRLLLDITAGTQMICGTRMDIQWKLMTISALAGYGGLCLNAQNIGVLRTCGVSSAKYVMARGLAGLMAAGFTAIQFRIGLTGIPANQIGIVNISCMLAATMAIPALLRLKKIIF